MSTSNRDIARAVITALMLVLVATVYGILKFDYGGNGNATASTNDTSTATTVTQTVFASPEPTNTAAPATITETVVVTAEPTSIATPVTATQTTSPPPANTLTQTSATGSESTPQPEPTSTTPTSAEDTPSATPAPPQTTTTSQPNQPPPLSEPMTSGRVRLTVNAVSSPPTVPMLFNRYEKDNILKSSPFAQYLETPPQAGAKYVRVDATIENIGSAPIGLTCNLPIHVGVLDPQQQRFDPLAELFRVKGNPECNEELEPGHSSAVAFVFEVPMNAVIGAFGFQDIGITEYNPTLITF